MLAYPLTACAAQCTSLPEQTVYATQHWQPSVVLQGDVLVPTLVH